jgi:hypothetical protein
MLQGIYCRHLYSQRRAGLGPVPHREGRLDAPGRLPHHLFHAMTVRLTSRDRELLLDLKEHGAALAGDLRRWFPSSAAARVRLLQLVRAGCIEVVGHHHGCRLFALGPAGKRCFGIHSNWRTRPQEAIRQVIWRRCHAQLVVEGYRKSSGQTLVVQVFATGPSARHLRGLLRQYRPSLVREGAVLCVFSPQTQPLPPCLTRSSLLFLKPLPSSRSPDPVQ